MLFRFGKKQSSQVLDSPRAEPAGEAVSSTVVASELSGHTPGNDPQSTDDAGRRKIAAPFKLALAAVFPAVALAKDYSPELPSERSSTVKAEDDTPADRAVPHPEKLATPVDVGPSLESTVTELELPTLDVDEPANLGVGATVLDRDLSPRDLLALDVEDLVNVKIVGVGSARGKSLDELVKSDLKELLSFGEVQAPHGDEIDVVNLDLEGLLISWCRDRRPTTICRRSMSRASTPRR